MCVMKVRSIGQRWPGLPCHGDHTHTQRVSRGVGFT